MEKDYFEGCSNIADIMNKEITIEEKIYDCMPKYVKRNYTTFTPSFDMLALIKENKLREHFIQIGMCGFVSWKWISPFVEWLDGRKCLEVMAGRGWLSYALRQKGVNGIATDNYSWASRSYPMWENTVTEVEKLDAVKSIEKYGADTEVVIMSWAYMDNTAYQVLKKLHEVNPNALLVYIGEYGGCTADAEFHENFEEVEDESFDAVIQNYESWENLRDSIYVGKMQTTKEK